ncbi:MAG TPA: toxin-antitoxin system HicB family antitoxin [Castellaniella sp.]|uniref:type II toxin-antitoxin system HicB family antitoxin n=1 Tax=Castellaniella sp. TaxID=1955812 RepID=UPI002F135F47
MDLKHYTYRVIWSEEDQEHVGLCTEFPSLSWLDSDVAGALRGIMQVVAAAASDMQANGETLPLPMSERQFSGRFAVRVPPMIHRKLAAEAAEKGVSMNRLVSAKLAM